MGTDPPAPPPGGDGGDLGDATATAAAGHGDPSKSPTRRLSASFRSFSASLGAIFSFASPARPRSDSGDTGGHGSRSSSISAGSSSTSSTAATVPELRVQRDDDDDGGDDFDVADHDDTAAGAGGDGRAKLAHTRQRARMHVQRAPLPLIGQLPEFVLGDENTAAQRRALWRLHQLHERDQPAPRRRFRLSEKQYRDRKQVLKLYGGYKNPFAVTKLGKIGSYINRKRYSWSKGYPGAREAVGRERARRRSLTPPSCSAPPRRRRGGVAVQTRRTCCGWPCATAGSSRPWSWRRPCTCSGCPRPSRRRRRTCWRAPW